MKERGRGEGREGSSQGIGPEEARQELLTAEGRSCGEWGDFPSLGSTPFKEGSEADQDRRKREEGFHSPKGEGVLDREESQGAGGG